MSNLSRKQREIAERHNHFLNIGRSLVHQDGFHQLSMDRVAELAEYSKGTIYQHFNSKEELLGQLCVNALQRLHALAQRAANHKGPHRERLLGVFIAHDLFQKQSAEDIGMMQYFQTDQVLEKLSPSTLERYSSLQSDIFNLVKQIVDDAIDAGELPKTRLSSADIVFGLWSMTHGAESLRMCKFSLKHIGVENSCLAIIELVNHLLDGLGWQRVPHTDSTDNSPVLEQVQRLSNALFKEIYS